MQSGRSSSAAPPAPPAAGESAALSPSGAWPGFGAAADAALPEAEGAGGAAVMAAVQALTAPAAEAATLALADLVSFLMRFPAPVSCEGISGETGVSIGRKAHYPVSRAIVMVRQRYEIRENSFITHILSSSFFPFFRWDEGPLLKTDLQ